MVEESMEHRAEGMERFGIADLGLHICHISHLISHISHQ